MVPAHPYNIHPAIRKHLKIIGMEDAERLESFLFPTLSELPPPTLFKSMDKAVALVLEAVSKEHEILIWGDYDVDGITATALLVLFFRQVGVSVRHHIPNRLTDGYGLNSKVLQKLSESMRADKLLITVDCGISNKDEIREAQNNGFRVIVTDHHQVPANALQADATINPKQNDCSFPAKDIAGVAVAFYLATAIRSAMRENNSLYPGASSVNMKLFLAYVAIGTVADLMPLTGINRLLVKGGFEVISSSELENFILLFDQLNISHKHVLSENISFQVAPAINAAGRLGMSGLPIDLLLTQSSEEACKLAGDLVRLNKKRKAVSRDDFDLALKQVAQSEVEDKSCLVLKGDFHDGILGITASRLAELFQIPVLVCCENLQDSMMLKGSGRAPDGFNLYQALYGCANYLKKFGGHEAAAGFSLVKDSFMNFKRCFEQSVFSLNLGKEYDSDPLVKEYINLPLSDALDPALLDNLLQLEPLGAGNPKPVFVDKDVRFVSLNHFGFNGDHIKGVVRGRYTNIPFIGFNLGKKVKTQDRSRPCSMKYSHMLNYFNGKTSWQIKAEDIW